MRPHALERLAGRTATTKDVLLAEAGRRTSVTLATLMALGTGGSAPLRLSAY